MEVKNYFKIGKKEMYLLKKHTTKAVNQIKATSYMLLRRCNRCSFSWLFTKWKCKQISWLRLSVDSQLTLSKLSSSIHRLHKSFIVGIQVYFWPILPSLKRINIYPINPPRFFKEISLVQYYYKIFSWSKKNPPPKISHLLGISSLVF